MEYGGWRGKKSIAQGDFAMITRHISGARTLLLVAAVLVTAMPVWAQFRGGAHPGAVGGVPPSIAAPAVRLAAPIYVPAQQFGTQSNYAYRPNSGYIPYVGYYLPNAAPASRMSRYADLLGTSGEAAPPAPAETYPTGSYFFSTPEVKAKQEGNAASSLNLDTVVEPKLTARVTVRLPVGAELWFDGTQVPSKGAVREFDTPALKPGRLYDYDVKANWKEDGRTVTQTQRVTIAAGSDVGIEFGRRAEWAVGTRK
jgi:uncharacterized protein (TIGR03000 family)